jgi:hypothetical protein
MQQTGRGQRFAWGLAPPPVVPHTAVRRAAALQLMRGVIPLVQGPSVPDLSFGVLLSGGDRRSLGRAATVLALVSQTPQRIGELVPLLTHPDGVVAMRAADVLEKVSRDYPASLQPYRRPLLRLLPLARQQEVQWHLALLVPRLTLTPAQRTAVFRVLEGYLRSESSIVRALALQGMADLVRQAPQLWPRVGRHLRRARSHGTPAMKARAKRLLTAAARRQ